MKKLILALSVISVTFSACVKVEIDDSTVNNGGTGPTGCTGTKEQIITCSKVITGVIDENVSLPKGKYTLKGYVFVNNRAVLTIAAGSTIVSDSIQKGALIVERNSRLFAEGTAADPIIFTSGKSAGTRAPGDWGGIVLLGNAPTNRSTTPIIEGGINSEYGGSVVADNSGTLTYVRIEFAGIAADPNSEINGLTCGGVGSGTKLENIQVSYGNDDAYEFFGGTVNPKYLIAFATADDDFDFDFGYSGRIQFGISLRDPLFVDGGDAGNGIECDNDGTGTVASPRTRPQLSNFTFCGPNGAVGTLGNHNFNTRWRRSTHFVLRNSILLGYAKGGFQFESDSTAQAYIDGRSSFRHNLVHAVTEPYKVSSTTLINAATVRSTAEAADSCKTMSNAADAMLENPFNLNAPNFMPKAGSPATATNAASFYKLPNFTVTAYIGAVGTTNWLQGWTSFTPKANVY
ncbi:MAG: hypothetical protein JNK14_18820 [Chitinophagaceae bacterium]|nr:hypothetical protein [Chitinophagaceae bacterium]